MERDDGQICGEDRGGGAEGAKRKLSAKDLRCRAAKCPLFGTGDPRCSTCDGPITEPRSCHNCKYSGKGHPACFTCPGPAEESGCGISYVHIDGMPAPDEFLRRNRNRTVEATSVRASDDPRPVSANIPAFGVPEQYRDRFQAAVENVVRRIAANLFSLSDDDIRIFRHVYNGDDIVQTGKALGMSKQVVWNHLKAMCRSNRVVADTIRGMMKNGSGGAKRGVKRNGMVQLDLFSMG